MGKSEKQNYQRMGDGGETISVVLRVLGAAVLGSSIALWGWLLYSVNANQQRLAGIEERVNQFQDNYYREQSRKDENERSIGRAVSEIRDYLKSRGWSGE